MTEGIKGQILKVGLAAAMSAPSAPTLNVAQPIQEVPVRQLSKVAAFGSQPEDSFLWTISQIESNGGRNTEHQAVASGPQKGEKAMGRWGLLHPTVLELIDRVRAHGQQYLPGRLGEVEGLGRDKMERTFKSDPDTELDVARYLGRHVLRRHGGDKLRAAYSWLHGHNLSKEAISEEMLAQSPYVASFSLFDLKVPKAFLLAQRGVHRLRSPASSVNKKPSASFRTQLADWQQRRREHERKLFLSRNNYVSQGPRLDTRRGGPQNGRERVEFILRNLAMMNRNRRKRT